MKPISNFELGHFIGTEGYHFNPLYPTIKYTDGVKYISDNGLNWLLLDICALILSDQSIINYLKQDDFLNIETDIREKTLKVTDGNRNTLVEKKYNYMDGNGLTSVVIYYTNNVLLLYSEY